MRSSRAGPSSAPAASVAARRRRRPAHRATARSRPAPRHQSAAAIAVRPAGCTRRSSSGTVPVPTSRRRPASRASRARAGRHPGAAASVEHLEPLVVEGRPCAGLGRHAAEAIADRVGGCRPVEAGVVDAELRREASASPSCGVGGRRAGGDRRRPPRRAGRRRRRRARRAARPPWHPAAISAERMPYTSPASSSGTSRNTDAPVRASPAISACCTGAAPRHAREQREVQVDPAVAGSREQRLAAPGRRRRRSRRGRVRARRPGSSRHRRVEPPRSRGCRARPPRSPPATA